MCEDVLGVSCDGSAVNTRALLAAALVACGLFAAVWLHRYAPVRFVTDGGCAKGGGPCASISHYVPHHPGWADPVAITAAIGGLILGATVFVRRSRTQPAT